MANADQPPVPDPTILTTAQLLRTVKAERDYVDGRFDVTEAKLQGEIAQLVERLGAIDRATRLLNETVNRVPTDVQKEVAHLRERADTLFASVALQFTERDERSERESRDNKVAVDAAFAAQKEAAAKQEEANSKAIEKSERATAESIIKLERLFDTNFKALGDKLDDLKQRVNTVEAIKIGSHEQAAGAAHQQGALVQRVGLMVAAGGLLITAVVIIANVLSAH